MSRRTVAEAKPGVPAEIWVMAWHLALPSGSVSHVSYGDQFYLSKEECQTAIDTMSGWLGMGDRKRYQPLRLVRERNAT